MLEVKKAKNQGHNAQMFSKKKGLLEFTARSLARFPRQKKGHDLGPFFTNQKIVLSSTAKRIFSRNCRLGGQGQGLQDVFSRTSSRTPPLKNSNAIQDKINFFLPKSQKNFYYFCLSPFAIEWDVFKKNHVDDR